MASKLPTSQASMTHSRRPRSASASPEVVNTPAPTMFPITRAAALTRPTRRASPLRLLTQKPSLILPLAHPVFLDVRGASLPNNSQWGSQIA